MPMNSPTIAPRDPDLLHDDRHREQDPQQAGAHRVTGLVDTPAPEIEQEQADPAERRAGQPRDNASDDTDEPQDDGDDGNERFHQRAMTFSISSG